MATTSKTVTEAVNEALLKLKTSDTFTISDLSKQLADSLNFNCKAYLPKDKALRKTSIDRQAPSYLYSATYTLVDDEEKQRRKQKKGA